MRKWALDVGGAARRVECAVLDVWKWALDVGGAARRVECAVLDVWKWALDVGGGGVVSRTG
ncbi:hypothetical protein GCM10009721_27050 [Terrabacter tumescens]|uniref:Uncharacterized protein n=1 Tax=Terrabacter tumescens TaxID=60443 RepID=A0ABQ2I3S5_9MICO|nr:hypothetical protein GCM10009721_27050 [Terrabacter tumescens]